MLVQPEDFANPKVNHVSQNSHSLPHCVDLRSSPFAVESRMTLSANRPPFCKLQSITSRYFWSNCNLELLSDGLRSGTARAATSWSAITSAWAENVMCITIFLTRQLSKEQSTGWEFCQMDPWASRHPSAIYHRLSRHPFRALCRHWCFYWSQRLCIWRVVLVDGSLLRISKEQRHRYSRPTTFSLSLVRGKKKRFRMSLRWKHASHPSIFFG